MISVTINGRERALDGELALPALLALLDITHPRIAVAHNGVVLRQEEYPTTTIRAGDTLEIVRMVGGGSDE